MNHYKLIYLGPVFSMSSINSNRQKKQCNTSISRAPTPARRPTTSDVVDFAKEATAALHKCAQDVARRDGIKARCSILVSQLYNVDIRLPTLEDLNETDVRKLFRLLYSLEQLSSVSICFPVVAYDLLCLHY